MASLKGLSTLAQQKSASGASDNWPTRPLNLKAGSSQPSSHTIVCLSSESASSEGRQTFLSRRRIASQSYPALPACGEATMGSSLLMAYHTYLWTDFLNMADCMGRRLIISARLPWGCLGFVISTGVTIQRAALLGPSGAHECTEEMSCEESSSSAPDATNVSSAYTRLGRTHATHMSVNHLSGPWKLGFLIVFLALCLGLM
ncbi:unnamed protein product [Protopolystoma xenopodis]|uniref:Uncharacterized protein n=1 Tax=Protopolystoma xenopodis TaxID=117903 RepID=A0A3S5A674_9PLAT|nr:unnamed protein product [Protopolystoma xenopodis]